MPSHSPTRALVLALVASTCATIAWAGPQTDVGPDPSDPHQHLRIPPALAEGETIVRVYVHLRNPGPEPEENEAAEAEVANAFGIRPGGGFNLFVAEGGVVRVRRLPSVASVEYRVYSLDGGGQVAVALLVTLQPAGEHPTVPASGALATGETSDLPMLWQDGRSLLKLIVNPSFGTYADRDPWLGNPGAFVRQPDQARTLGVVEAGLEVGVGGITGLGSSDTYLYGATSYVASTTLGRDIFTSDSARVHGELEDLYGGILVARKGTRRSFNLSLGRQKFSLNRNLLIGHVLGASNGGDRAASNLSPRNAYDMTIDARFRLGDVVIQGWFADPNELPGGDTRSQYAGLNLKYNDNRRVDASLTLLGVTRSDARYPTPDGAVLSREGLRAVNPRLRWNTAFGVEGLWLEAEWAHEWNADFRMSADGAGVWAGYTFTRSTWRPAVLYRYALFTGDDPATATYERFDPLTGGVQRDWAQGMDMIKVAINRNLRTHRFEISCKPVDGLELSVDYYRFIADTRNNLGGQPPVATYAGDHLGDEITPTLQWLLKPNVYVQALASFLFPGRGLEGTLPAPTHTWQTYQLSFYLFF